jgi:U3 small nucleolar RNA-associated protein 25
MDAEDANTPTTRLLTLLNVSALKSRKRPSEAPYPREKLNKRRHLNTTADGPRPEPVPFELQNEAVYQPGDDLDAAEQEIDEYQGDQNDLACEPSPPLSINEAQPNHIPTAHNPYDQHFGPNPEILTEHSRTAVDQKRWKSRKEKLGKLNVVASVLSEASVPPQKKRAKKTAVRPVSTYYFQCM